MICGLGSSPPSVMARSRLVRGVLQNLTRGDAVPEGAGSPPPSTMRSSAHSWLILYLEWIKLNPEESFRRFSASVEACGFVLERP